MDTKYVIEPSAADAKNNLIENIEKDVEFVDNEDIFNNASDIIHMDNIRHIFNGLVYSFSGNRAMLLARMFWTYVDRRKKDKIKDEVLNVAFPRYREDKRNSYTVYQISEDLFVIRSFSHKKDKEDYYYGVYVKFDDEYNFKILEYSRASLACLDFDSAVLDAIANKNRNTAIYNSVSACKRLLGMKEN